nr:AEL_HP1_G0019580.mRNA.1.CDS.1 [Saccharomyces cerevisiae]
MKIVEIGQWINSSVIMSKYQINCIRYRHFLRTSNISQIPDFTKYCIGPVNEELAPYIMETMKAYPSNSEYINPQHYYHNRTLAQYYDDSTKLTRTKIINSGKFVKEELVIRIAHKLNQLQQLPFNVVNNFHFVQVYESYYNILKALENIRL